ncbi:MAG: hypothetical protein ACRDRN_22905 [Sciscionella sp.]
MSALPLSLITIIPLVVFAVGTVLAVRFDRRRTTAQLRTEMEDLRYRLEAQGALPRVPRQHSPLRVKKTRDRGGLRAVPVVAALVAACGWFVGWARLHPAPAALIGSTFVAAGLTIPLLMLAPTTDGIQAIPPPHQSSSPHNPPATPSTTTLPEPVTTISGVPVAPVATVLPPMTVYAPGNAVPVNDVDTSIVPVLMTTASPSVQQLPATTIIHTTITAPPPTPNGCMLPLHLDPTLRLELLNCG